jgi:hypothetical protein
MAMTGKEGMGQKKKNKVITRNPKANRIPLPGKNIKFAG